MLSDPRGMRGGKRPDKLHPCLNMPHRRSIADSALEYLARGILRMRLGAVDVHGRSGKESTRTKNNGLTSRGMAVMVR